MTIEHVPKLYNGDANWLAQHASGYRPIEGIMALELPADDWRKETVDYLEDLVGVYCQACSGIPLAVRFVGRDRLL